MGWDGPDDLTSTSSTLKSGPMRPKRRKTRRTSEASVPRPGPSSTSCSGSGWPALAHSLTSHTPSNCENGGQVALGWIAQGSVRLS